MKKIVILFLFNINLFSIDFNFLDYFIIEDSYKESPIGEITEIGLNNLVKYSNDRYLAILWEERNIPYKEPSILSHIEKQKKKGKL